MDNPPKLSYACPLPWQQMTGDERRRFCSQCGHHVHNLSLLGRAEREALLARAGQERVCGTYYLRLSGGMVTPDRPLSERERRNLKQLGAAALSAGALALAAGCVTPPPAVEPTSPPTSALQRPAEVKPASPAKTAEAKPEEEEVIILMGFMVLPDQPARKPGPTSKHW